MTHLVLLLALATTLAAQTFPPEPSNISETKSTKDLATVSGRIIDGQGAGIKRASVTLTSTDPPKTPGVEPDRPQVFTDGNGHFELKVPPGLYYLSPFKQGYFRSGRSGAAASSPAPMRLRTGQHTQELIIRMLPLGVIAGRVVSDEGEPLSSISVACLRPSQQNGQVRWQPAGISTSNDLGEYRLHGLYPGKCLLYASPAMGYGSGTGGATYSEAFFPNADDIEKADLVDVSGGSVLTGRDFKLRAISSFRVEGSVSGGNAATTYVAYLKRPIGQIGAPEPFAPVVDGRFSFSSVPAGNYVLRVAAPRNSMETGWGYSLVKVVDGNVKDVKVAIQPKVTISGKARSIDGGSLFDKPGPMLVALYPEKPLAPGVLMDTIEPAVVDQEGRFQFQGVTLGEYRFVILDGRFGYPKSVRLGDQPADNGRIEVSSAGTIDAVVSQDVAKLSVTTLDSKKRLTAGVFVEAVPSRPGLNPHIRYTSWTNKDGVVDLQWLPPGEYRVYAFESVGGNMFDSDFLRDQGGEPTVITLAPNSKQRITMQYKAPASGGELERENEQQEDTDDASNTQGSGRQPR